MWRGLVGFLCCHSALEVALSSNLDGEEILGHCNHGLFARWLHVKFYTAGHFDILTTWFHSVYSFWTNLAFVVGFIERLFEVSDTCSLKDGDSERAASLGFLVYGYTFSLSTWP